MAGGETTHESGLGAGLGGRSEQAEQARRFGSAIGWLFVGGSVLALPSTFLVDPRPPAEIYIVLGLGFCAGLLILGAPWERLSLRWFHLTASMGTALITVAVALGGRSYGFLYVLVVVGCACVFRSRAEVAVHVVLVGLALMAPLLWEPEEDREIVQNALLALPGLVLMAASIVYMRERLESAHRRHVEFAEEAIALTTRIRTRGGGQGASGGSP